MLKNKFIVAFALFGVLVWQQDPMATEPAPSAIVDPCSSYFEIDTPGMTMLVCPQGDGHSFDDVVAGINLWVRDWTGSPIPGIPATDIWVVDCNLGGWMALCGGSGSCDADAPTDAAGFTTIRDGTIAAGGCADGIVVVVQGVPIMDPGGACATPRCAEVFIRSADLDGNLVIGAVDFAIFALAWPPGPYDACVDLDGDAEIALRDVAYFALHFLHECE